MFPSPPPQLFQRTCFIRYVVTDYRRLHLWWNGNKWWQNRQTSVSERSFARKFNSRLPILRRWIIRRWINRHIISSWINWLWIDCESQQPTRSISNSRNAETYCTRSCTHLVQGERRISWPFVKVSRDSQRAVQRVMLRYVNATLTLE